jgi:hypothetical protein
MIPGRRQVYEEEFAERAQKRGESELVLREIVLSELLEEQERLSRGRTKEELEAEHRFETSQMMRARNERAIATGNLESLIKEEELEKKAELVRGQLKKELGLQRALHRAPVFLLTAVRRAETERMFNARVFNSLVKSKLNTEMIRRAIRKAKFSNGELAVDKERAIAVLHGAKGRALLNALKTA